MSREAQLEAQLDTMAAALHRLADRLVAEQAAAAEALLAMTQERDRALDRARESERNSTDAITRAQEAWDGIECAKQAARLEAMHERFVADAVRDELATERAYAGDLRAELAAAYRAASALRRGVPRWLVPTCAAVGAARDVADEWRDRAKGLVVRARRAARKAVRG